MLGISYGAISQLFTAQLDPPDLEAIAPLSTIDATATTLYPGGILNTGFAVDWAEQRQQEAEPAGPNSGQPWAYQRIQQGDQTCAANQALHGEATDLLAKIKANAHYVPSVADPLDPISFVDKITVPTFMACQWEDEQTGGHCPDLVQHFTGTKLKWFTFTNGTHVDSLDPYTFDRERLPPAARPPATPTRRSNSRSQASRSPARPRARGTSARRAPSLTSRRRARAPIPTPRMRTRCPGPTTRATPGRAGSGAMPPSGSGAGSSPRRVVPCRIARHRSRRTRPSSAPAPSTSGSSPRLRTSISRRRSARSDRTERRRSSRTAGCARASASSRPARTTCSSKTARCSSRSRRSSRQTSSRCRPVSSPRW
jgi:hypothetical protein